MPDSIAPILRRRTILTVQAETTMGTANYTSTAAVGDFYDIKCALDGVLRDGKRMPANNLGGNFKATPGKQTGTLTFRMQIKPSDAFQTLLTGCGMTLSASVNAPGTPVGGRKTLSFKIYEIGDNAGTLTARVKQLFGAVGNCVLTFKSGAPAEAQFTFRGVWGGLATDVTSLPANAPNANLPFVCTAMTATFAASASTTPRIDKLVWNQNNNIEEVEDVTTTQGVAYFIVTERDYTLEADPESRLKAALDNYALAIAGTEIAISIVLTLSINTLTFTIPKAQRRDIGEDARGEKRVDALTLQLNASSGDDELTVTAA